MNNSSPWFTCVLNCLESIEDLPGQLTVGEPAVAQITHAAHGLLDCLQQLGLFLFESLYRSIKLLCRTIELRNDGVDVVLRRWPSCSWTVEL